MALSSELQTHVDNVLAAVALELAGLNDKAFVKDRVKLNVRDRMVQAVEAAIQAEDWGDVANPGGND